MQSIKLLTVVFLSLCLVHSCSVTSQTQNANIGITAQPIVLRAARMLDVDTGKIISDAVIVVQGDKIVAAGSRISVPAGSKMLDLGDVTLLPGLIDAHTHITYHFDESGLFGATQDPSPEITLKYAETNARKTVEAGFTTIRNLGAGDAVDIRLRDEVKNGKVEGPRMLVSGQPFTPNLLSKAKESERIDIIRGFVNARISEGVDVIKIFEGVDRFGEPLESPDEIRAAVDLAHRAGLKVAVHAHEAAAVIAAVEGGCDSIEHGSFMDNQARSLMVKDHVPLVPTIYLPTHYLSHRNQFVFPASTWSFFEKLKANNQENLRLAKRAGIKIIAGSDAVAGLHGQNAQEIIWLAKSGLTPAEALRASTVDAAELLGLQGQIGDLKQGYFADIIAVPGDPLTDISVLETVAFVMKSGRVIKSNV